MKEYEIVIDSTCDLTVDLRKRFRIYEDYIRAVVYLPSNEIKANLDWENISSNDFYKIVRSNVGDVKTAFATFEEFARVVKPILDNGKDVMVFVISSGISGTSNAYKNYAEIILDDYKDRKIEIIDTLKYSSASGLLAIMAAKNKEEGLSFEDNVKLINEKKYHLHEMGVMDDLRFLAKNGRVSASKAFFGSLIGVQPVADFTIDGKTSVLGSIKGEKAANKFSLEYLLKTITDIEDQIIFVTHSQREERAKLLKEQLEKVAHPKEVIITEVGQSCGPNIGPGICTYFYFGNRISENHLEENKLYNELKEKL